LERGLYFLLFFRWRRLRWFSFVAVINRHRQSRRLSAAYQN
jgi:hypothetical protein